MSRIKLLLDLIEDVRAVADDLQTIADAMASDEPAAETTEMPVRESPAENGCLFDFFTPAKVFN